MDAASAGISLAAFTIAGKTGVAFKSGGIGAAENSKDGRVIPVNPSSAATNAMTKLQPNTTYQFTSSE
jgi:hypothetical protein